MCLQVFVGFMGFRMSNELQLPGLCKKRLHSPVTHLFQFVHEFCESSQSLQVVTPLIGHSDEPMEGVIHAVVEFGGRGESRPAETK